MRWANNTWVLLNTESISIEVIGKVLMAPRPIPGAIMGPKSPGAWREACRNRLPAKAWYPTAARVRPLRSAIKPRLINRLVSPLLGLTELAKARPQRTTNQPCQRLQSSTKNDRVVNESPGPRPKARSALATTRLPMLLNVSTPTTTTPSTSWAQKRTQPTRRRANEIVCNSTESAMKAPGQSPKLAMGRSKRRERGSTIPMQRW